jgi:putative tryptophan/tyrosine transport system substrate-binding protein
VKMRRRLLIALAASALAVPFVSVAQSQGRTWRIGMLETVSTELNGANLDAFRKGLLELGYVEGRNLIIEYRSADGRSERFAALATELVGLKVDLIVTRGTPAAVAAKNATRTIPVVMANAGDPVDSGLVTSLARPGGNVTGLSSLTVPLEAKRFGLLRELVPGITRIAALYNMSSPANPPQWKEIETAARSLSIQPQLLDVRRPEDLAPAFDAATRQRADGLIVGQEGLFQANRKLIAELAAKHRLPAIYRSMEFIEAGGLMAYGPSYPDLYRRAATYVDKILKGAKPGDLPVEQPTKFELIINLKTAKALGLTIPQSLLLRADEVIQ